MAGVPFSSPSPAHFRSPSQFCQSRTRSRQVLLPHRSSQLSNQKPPNPPPPPLITAPQRSQLSFLPFPSLITAPRSNQSARPIYVMAGEFILAFQDLQEDDSNNEKMVDFVCSHYASSLISPEFCSTLQRPPPFIFHNFLSDDLSCLLTPHSIMVNTLKPMYTVIFVASRLEFETKSLSETVDDRKKVAAVKRSSEKLLQKVKNYNGEIKWVKQKVLNIIIKP